MKLAKSGDNNLGWRARFAAIGVVIAMLSGGLAPALAQDGVGAVTGLPLPRLVSVRADEVNVRTGPGVRYPIDWVFVRQNMPVEVLNEFESWRQVRDWQGTTGWVHRSMLSGKRTVMITDALATLRRETDPASPPVARAERGVVAELDECEGQWCRLVVGDLKGWLPRTSVWGATLGETAVAEGVSLPIRPAQGPEVALPEPASNN